MWEPAAQGAGHLSSDRWTNQKYNKEWKLTLLHHRLSTCGNSGTRWDGHDRGQWFPVQTGTITYIYMVCIVNAFIILLVMLVLGWTSNQFLDFHQAACFISVWRKSWGGGRSVAGLPYIGNYHAVTAGPMPPLVVLIHTRG